MAVAAAGWAGAGNVLGVEWVGWEPRERWVALLLLMPTLPETPTWLPVALTWLPQRRRPPLTWA